MDISASTGTEIIATLPARFYSTPTYSGGGKTVILDHDVNILFHDAVRIRLSSYYMHLDNYSPLIENASRGDVIAAGQVIGYVSSTGAAVSPHLHFELRLGSRCSLEYQLDNPSSSCNVGFDPHVHPLGLFSGPASPVEELQLSVLTTVTSSEDGVIEITAPDVFPVANRYALFLVGKGKETLIALRDLNLREGFDASSTATIDDPGTDRPHLEPQSFGRSATIWTMRYRIPAGYGSKSAGETFKLVITNIYDETFVVTFGNTSDSW